MLLGAPGEAGRISDRAQRCSATIHIATNTTFAAIDDIATARQHGSAAPPLPTTPSTSDCHPAGHRAPHRRLARVALRAGRSRQGDLSRRLIDPCGAKSKRAIPAGPCGAIGRAGVDRTQPVAEQHHLIFTKKKFAAARDRAAPLAREDKRPTRLTGGVPSTPGDVDRAVVDDPAARGAGGRRRQQRAARSPKLQRSPRFRITPKRTIGAGGQQPARAGPSGSVSAARPWACRRAAAPTPRDKEQHPASGIPARNVGAKCRRESAPVSPSTPGDVDRAVVDVLFPSLAG